MQSQAYLEFQLNSKLEAAGNKVAYAGYVQCFCDDQAATITDYQSDTLYGITETSTDNQ